LNKYDSPVNVLPVVSDSQSGDATAETHSETQSGNEFVALTDAKIMMIDDEPSTIEILQLFLQDSGYKHFIKTSESAAAFGIVLQERPDVVLLDLMMPDVSGFEILLQLRADKILKHVPVIVLTSSTDSNTKLKALELGANDFLAKPVDASELALRLRNTLAAKAYQDRLAFYDPLTGLHNRRTFMDHVDWALSNAKRDLKSCAILQINLDRFKQVNDTLGPRVGDALLKEVAAKLEACVRACDFLTQSGSESFRGSLSRVGGDEFTVLLVDIVHEDDAAHVARRIIGVMGQQFNPEGHESFISASIGIAVYPNDGDETNTLIKHANVAVSVAKKRGGNTCEFYAKNINKRSADRLDLANQLRKALDHDELRLYYQPKIDIRTGQIFGAEALMRWENPSRGLVSPGVFIPMAEDMGIIDALGEWAMRIACNQSKVWQLAGLGKLRIAVNVSGQQLYHGKIVSTVRNILDSTGLNPQYLELELTESLMMNNVEENITTLNQLKEMGVSLAIDDFGTGYSSLSYLTSFPVDVLKIDRSFVKDLPGQTNDRAIVTAIVAMARSLNLSIVAEGIENKDQLAFLVDLGCECYQGFLFGKAVPAAQFIAMLTSKKFVPESLATNVLLA